MSTATPLVPVRTDELKIGLPVPYALYTRDGTLVAPQGFVIDGEAALRRLLDVKPFRQSSGVQVDDETGSFMARPDGDGRASRDPLAEIRHAVEAVQLQFSLPGDPQPRSVPAQFFGILPQVAIILSPPYLGGRRGWSEFESLPVTVRMTTPRHAYQFESAVLRHTALPVPHLYLRYPVEARQRAFRGAVRLETRMPAVVRLEDGRQVPVTITNLSGNGCGIESEHLLGEVGSALTVVFRAKLDDGAWTLTVPAIVRNLPRPGKERVRYGLQFGDEFARMDWHLRLALKAFIYEQLLAA